MSIEIGSQVSIGSSQGGGSHPIKPPPLTEEQKQTATSILETFEGKALTEDDAKSIAQAFKDAGIRPGEDLRTIVEDAGFDAGEIAELAGIQSPQGRPPGPPPSPPPLGQITGINQEALQTLQEILSNYEDLSNLTEDEEQVLTQQLSDAGLLSPGALVDMKT